jgi:hypothetical protein
MKTEDWLRRKNFGELYQGVLHHLIDYEHYEVAPDKKFSDWDVKYFHGDNMMTCEVKADTLNIITGNIAIEFESNNVPSGISVTKADYYAIFAHNPRSEVIQWWFIPTDVIREKIKEQKYEKIIYGGHNNLSKMYIFRDGLFLNYGEVLDKKTIPQEDRAVMYFYLKRSG